MFDVTKTWCSVELTKDYADILKVYLRKMHIYFEPSEAGQLIHFECNMTKEECDLVNAFLYKVMAKGAVQNEQPAT